MRALIEHCQECGKREDGKWMDEMAKALRDKQLCFSCNFWIEKVEIRDKSRVARINGHYYQISSIWGAGAFRGFGGQKSVILFHDGRRVKTTNLWHQGEIPVRFRERLPNNAKFGEV